MEGGLKTVRDQFKRRYKILLLRIGALLDQMHFLRQGVPILSEAKIARRVKSLIPQGLFVRVSKPGEAWCSSGFLT